MIPDLRATVMRSTPLRLTGMLIGIFLLSLLVSLGIAFVVIRNSIDTAIQVQMADEFKAYRLVNDQTDLEEQITQQAAVVAASMAVLAYRADDGRMLGNVADFPAVGGVTIVPGSAVPDPDAAATYLVESNRLGKGVLTLGYSREQVSKLGEVFSLVFLISPLVTLGLAGIIGLWVARAARDRVEAIRTTLHDLTEGKLEARVPGTGTGPDDLSQIGIAVNQMASAQAATVASLKQVSADIAHDLKTPIQRVSVLLEKLEMQGELSPPQRDTVDSARRETDQIARTFQSLLQIAQLEGGVVRDRFQPVELAGLAAGILDVYVPAAEETGHALSLADCRGESFVVSGERNLLGQVIANLIENALRHTPGGSAITLGLSRADGRVCLMVRDNGPGVPADERQNVLRRLYRLERSRTSEGSGLGLSMVAAICDLHGATLSLGDARPGLLVTVTFPPA